MITFEVHLDPSDDSSLTHQIDGRRWTTRRGFIQQIDDMIDHVERAAELAGKKSLIFTISVGEGDNR